MKFLIIVFALIATGVAQAAQLECNSEQIRLAGPIDTHYLRMGHSKFSGTLTLYTYQHRVLVDARTINVAFGEIQDERSLSTSAAEDQFGNPVSFKLTQNQTSTLTIGNQTRNFTPFCQFTNESTPRPETCQSHPSLGKICHQVGGKCVCNQHNPGH